MRVGLGYDVHRLVENRKLILGGVEIPFEKGLLGHSDADVLLHAIMDSLLGACALGDIGKHFPDTDNSFKGISSILLLKETGKLIEKAGYIINNIDATIIAQKPKINPHKNEIKSSLSKLLNLPKQFINIKASTAEKLGAVGREEGVVVQAMTNLRYYDWTK